MQEKINALYLRLIAQSKDLLQFGLPNELKGLISFQSLKTIYFYLQVREVKAWVEKELLTPDDTLRLDKIHTQLARTLNLIIDPLTQDIQLILETKSKVENKEGVTEKSSIPVFCGTTKSTKPAWRIDTPKPIKMANAVFYAHEEQTIDQDLQAARDSAFIAEDIVEKAGVEASKFINVMAIGVERKVKGLRIHTFTNETLPYFAKQSYYSEYALGDLTTILSEATHYHNLSLKTCHYMTENLLQALKLVQDAGVILQDIKPDNILVYQNEEGDYTLTLTDFGLAYHPTIGSSVLPLASVGFESPEILALYDNQNNQKDYRFFHESTHPSYAKDIYANIISSGPIPAEQLNTYHLPHKANDIWALGIVLHELYKNETPNNDSDYSDMPLLTGMLAPNRKDRLTIDQALDIFYEMPQPPAPPFSLHEKIKEFYFRIENQLNLINTIGLPTELENLILADELKAIYAYLQKPENQATMFKTLVRGMPYRLDKADTSLARTLNLVFDPLNSDIELLLETKSKKVNALGNTEKAPIPIFSGATKSIKPAWRIDTPTPIKMANAVFYALEKDFIEDDLNDERTRALIERYLVEKIGLDATKFINVNAIGVEREKQGLRSHSDPSRKKPYFAKQSYYSEYALGDLEFILKKSDLYPLTPEARHEMAEHLLRNIKCLQENKIVHQDLKPKNILIYPRSNGGYIAKIIDFGIAYHPRLTPYAEALATYGHESPEISAIYSQKDHKHYRYFHTHAYPSYAKGIYTKMIATADFSSEQLASYEQPHYANDMWSIGLVLHELYKNKQPDINNDFSDMPLLAGLLQPDRASRFTIDEALALFESTSPELKTVEPIPISKAAKSYIPGYNQKSHLNLENKTSENCPASYLVAKKVQIGK